MDRQQSGRDADRLAGEGGVSREITPFGTGSTYFADDGVDVPAGMEVVAPVLAAGDVLFFGGAVIHGSGPNRSRDRFRRSFICHYVGAATTHLNPWNRPVETFDRRVIHVNEAPVGPWQNSFVGRKQGKGPH